MNAGGKRVPRWQGQSQPYRGEISQNPAVGSHPIMPPAAAPEVQTQLLSRILVVDDNADAADTLAEILRLAGYEVRCAGHAAAAMALLDSYVPQLALLDIGLPDIDGYQLAGLLRADPRAAGMKLVALTGYGRDNDRALALAATFDEHLVKPVMIDRLLELLRELMEAR
jgi:CheY-like chemotaxis protein